ncbi:PREDICTED: uncharacterized protein LOC105516838 [Colobus angolensis palliatus]|uniref:uncharacterized protein LOC105516838 n=1 Tax=Colobus angolensis palliatus TaxID=336983 RepID=UPI0005F551D5|nr:PREDICTED: uncharacterized protein LOC105516838 [Colobus angolensis palliatus]
MGDPQFQDLECRQLQDLECRGRFLGSFHPAMEDGVLSGSGDQLPPVDAERRENVQDKETSVKMILDGKGGTPVPAPPVTLVDWMARAGNVVSSDLPSLLRTGFLADLPSPEVLSGPAFPSTRTEVQMALGELKGVFMGSNFRASAGPLHRATKPSEIRCWMDPKCQFASPEQTLNSAFPTMEKEVQNKLSVYIEEVKEPATISLCGVRESQCRCWALTLVYQVARKKGLLLLSACASNTETQAFGPRGALCLHRKHEPDFPVMGSIFSPSSLRCLADRKAMSFLNNFSPKNL